MTNDIRCCWLHGWCVHCVVVVFFFHRFGRLVGQSVVDVVETVILITVSTEPKVIEPLATSKYDFQTSPLLFCLFFLTFYFKYYYKKGGIGSKCFPLVFLFFIICVFKSS